MIFKCNLEFELTDQTLNYLNANDVIDLLRLSWTKRREKSPVIFFKCKLQSK